MVPKVGTNTDLSEVTTRAASPRPPAPGSGQFLEVPKQGQPVFEEGTGEPLTEAVVVQVALDPLPLEIEQPVYDDATGERTVTIIVPNPAVVRDDAERAVARAVIDGTPNEVIAFAEAEESVGP